MIICTTEYFNINYHHISILYTLLLLLYCCPLVYKNIASDIIFLIADPCLLFVYVNGLSMRQIRTLLYPVLLQNLSLMLIMSHHVIIMDLLSSLGIDSRFFDRGSPPEDVTCVDLDTNMITQ